MSTTRIETPDSSIIKAEPKIGFTCHENCVLIKLHKHFPCKEHVFNRNDLGRVISY